MAKEMIKKESDETPEDEAAETPEIQAKEAKEGTEEHDVVPEEFKTQVNDMVSEYKNSKPCLQYMCDMAEQAMGTENESDTPSEFTDEDMPE